MNVLVGKEVPGRWRGKWCWSEERGGPRLTVRRFRQTIELDSVPDEFVVYASADSRYVLWVNGQPACRGPLKGVPEHYFYEACDIAPYLKPGKNILAVEVVWFGLDAPNSEVHTGYAAWLFQGPEDHPDLATPGAWKVAVDEAVSPDTTPYANALGFLGYLEKLDAARYPHGWKELEYNDAAWTAPITLQDADTPGNWGEVSATWDLYPREVEALTEEPRRFSRTVVDMKPAEHLFDATPKGWTIPAGGEAELVLDAGTLTTGYPEFEFEGGAGRSVQMIYGEAVHNVLEPGKHYGKREKGVRDDLSFGIVDGYFDTVTLDGSNFTYEPFHWRTFWFIRLKVSAGDTPLTIRDARYRFTIYPQELKASFESSDPDSAKMMELTWRTLQLCTHETYEDCPYYEQLHYIADTRLEALQSFAFADMYEQARRSIRLYRDSLRSDGLIHCRVPSRRTHRLPFFALIWVQMVEDYWMWAGEPGKEFVRGNLYAVDGVLSWFRNLLNQDGFVGPVPYWSPVNDCGPTMKAAIAEGGSTYMTGRLIQSIDAAVRMHTQAGNALDGFRWKQLAEMLRQDMQKAWSEKEGLFLEGIGREGDGVVTSQHTQCMAILSGVATPEQTARIVERFLDDESMARMYTMNVFYLARALEKAGRYDLVATKVFEPWREQIRLRLSTWWEHHPNGRSDCHAWSGWVGSDMLTSVLGIRPKRPGFEEILIQPQTGAAEWARGHMPTPKGLVKVDWKKEAGGAVTLKADTPKGVAVEVVLNGQSHPMPAGGAIQLKVT